MAELVQTPAPGSRLLRCAGDRLILSLSVPAGFAKGRAFARTNIDGVSWKDLPMAPSAAPGSDGAATYVLELRPRAVGVFAAKTYFLPDGASEPVWPSGADVLVKVAPAWTRCGCSIYTAFTRQFRADDGRAATTALRDEIAALDRAGYAVIPPSGTFRTLAKRLDHIIGGLGFNIVQLLPVHPVPTTYARMGRFGSPFASLDFYSVDPALAEFDESATPLDQFVELADAVHARGARLFLDLPANHTGWASTFHTHHPEWFRRNGDGSFHSPGAWGVTWADLVELDYSRPAIRDAISDVFLFWCAKGVDGFRCDAGYMIPCEVWRHVVGKVRAVFPDTVFLLEGLGGKLEVTDALLSDAGLDWAYSEIFQQGNRDALSWYLPPAIGRSESFGPLVNFAETHDNNRLAANGNAYASMRTALAALLSQQGAFGITAGVEWFCRDKIDVHGAPPLNWGASENQCRLISRLNAILAAHPAFQVGAHLEIVTRGAGNVIAALRTVPSPAGSAAAEGTVLVAVNLDCATPARVEWPAGFFAPQVAWDLVSSKPASILAAGETAAIDLPPGGFAALVPSADTLRAVETQEEARVRSGCVSCVPASPQFSGRVVEFDFPRDARRTVMVPPGFALRIASRSPFRALLLDGEGMPVASCVSTPAGATFAASVAVPAGDTRRFYTLSVTCYGEETARTQSPVLALPSADKAVFSLCAAGGRIRDGEDVLAVLANRRGAMAQVRAAWGEIRSQYDALLAVNPDPRVPANKQVFLARCKAWVRHCGYSFELDASCLESFRLLSEHAAAWRFSTPVGRGDTAVVEVVLCLSEGDNLATLRFSMPELHRAGNEKTSAPIELVLRPDVEARDFHGPTLAYAGAEQVYPAAVRTLPNGFDFDPPGCIACGLRLPDGTFHKDGIWSYSVPHPVEAERGLSPTGDLYSPGWFSIPLVTGRSVCLVAGETSVVDAFCAGNGDFGGANAADAMGAPYGDTIRLGDWLASNPARLFVADRDDLKTVIAGYPWFLDWGRDTLIVLRGLLAAGETDTALAILREFGRFEEGGTLPNIIHGSTIGNRDTSDAPLWFVVAAGDAMALCGDKAVASLDCGGRPLGEVMSAIARGYLAGTPNGIKVDLETGLVFSPSHFTWMDTNYPAGTPRAGYPVEIQALWIAALATIRERLGVRDFEAVERKARESLVKYYVLPEGWLADSLRVRSAVFEPASAATPEDALRPNQLLAVTLGALDPRGETARAVVAATASLLVPGGIRSLGDRAVNVPQPVWNGDRLLNDPMKPYWGRYEGDEDTRRKPAYHNGTAWGWQFPLWCEAWALAGGEEAREPARAVLASAAALLETGCLGQLPEILDGDSPHIQRGCLAQAWSISELQRVWRALDR